MPPKKNTKAEARRVMSALVDVFDRDLPGLKLASGFGANSREAQVEDKFIKPFWRCLNWNVSNEGLARIRDEFVVQASMKIGKTTKAPDYLLRVPDAKTGRMRKVLFVEAKHPKYDLQRDVRWIRQAYQYAHSTLSASDIPENRVRLALLTDFEEFRLFDCLDPYPLEHEGANAALFVKYIVPGFDITFDQYIPKFDLLWDTFERDNVAAGSLAKLAVTLADRKRARTPPNERFLDDLNRWREALARGMFKNDKTLTDVQLTAATQLLIDRIVFVKMLTDRGIEDDYLSDLIAGLAKTSDADVSLYDACKDVFRRLNVTYNGSIFQKRDDLDRVKVENKVIRSILESLRPERSIYTLAAMPVEIIGFAYENFLGSVISRKGKGLSVTEKPEVRKAGGVYYTPRNVVDFVVDRAIGPILARCKTPSDVAGIRIVDPSCGSGSFLVVVYERLLRWHREWAEKNAVSRSKGGAISIRSEFRGMFDAKGLGDGKFRVRPTVKLRRDILTNCIFGVDIDPQAAEVARFSLSMKAVEDVEREELYSDVSLFKMTVLPDLTGNIKCGNSLVAPGWNVSAQGSFTPEATAEQINAFSWEREFPSIAGKGKKGFDAVVGNPPWGATFTDDELRYLKSKHSRVVARMVDSYIYFFDKAIQLSPNGIVAFVVPATILNQTDAAPLRKLLVSRGLSTIVDLGKDIFTTKVLNTSAVVITGTATSGSLEVGSVAKFPLADRAEALHDMPMTPWSDWKAVVDRDPHGTFFTGHGGASTLLDKLRAVHPALSTVLDENGIQRGVSPDFAGAHVLTPAVAMEHGIENGVLKSSLSGSQIKRYRPFKSDQRIIYTTRKTKIEDFPRAHAYLKGFRSENTCREVKEGKHQWWCLHRPRDPVIFQSPKFIGLTTAKTIELVYDGKAGLYVTDAMYVFAPPTGHDWRICMAILQSKVFLYLYRVSNQGEQRVIPQVKATKLGALPYPVSAVGRAVKLRIPENVDRIMALYEKLSVAKTDHERTTVQREIDAVDEVIERSVQTLYGLSDSDVELMESGVI